MVTITAALQRIKDDPQAVVAPSVAEGVCRELGLEWKNTPLTPPVTLALLIQQVLHGNTANAELIRLAGLNITAAAYCTAKGRLPVEAARQVSRRVGDVAVGSAGVGGSYRWKGHRTWHCDGSSFSMPDTPELQERYGQPGGREQGMSPEEYRQMPETLVVREIRRTIRRKGFRTRTVTLVTTLLDPVLYPADEVVELSEQRWGVEVNLRHLKTTMGMEALRSQGCEGIERELWALVLACNLVRVIMMEAAQRQRVAPNRISFADALYWMRHANQESSSLDWS